MSQTTSSELLNRLRSKLVAPLKLVPSDEAKILDNLPRKGLQVRELLAASSDELFVTEAIQKFFQRPASPSCVKHYVQFLRSKALTRAQVLEAFEGSEEGTFTNVRFVGLTGLLSEDRAAIKCRKARRSVWRSIKNIWKNISLAVFLQNVFREYSLAQDEKALVQDNRMNQALEELKEQLMQAESRIAELEKVAEGFICSNTSRSNSISNAASNKQARVFQP